MRIARHVVGWSQTELADMLGVNQGSVSRYETGKIKISQEKKDLLFQALSEHGNLGLEEIILIERCVKS